MKYELVPKDVLTDALCDLNMVRTKLSDNNIDISELQWTLDRIYTTIQHNRTAVNVQPNSE